MYTVYHNPRCSKSRDAVDYLKGKEEGVTIREYLTDALNEEELTDLLTKLKMNPFELIRTKEDVFQQKYRGKNLSTREWITAMVENPKLIERPIVVFGSQAVIARPTEKIEDLKP